MTTTVDPALFVALAHERRRQNPLPSLGDLPLGGDDAVMLARREELRRAAEKLGAVIDRARTP